MGGITRTVINLADHLSSHYDVELVAVTRRRRESFFAFPAEVKVISLNDRYAKIGLRWRLVRALLGRCPSLLVHEHDNRYAAFSLWTDLLLLNYLKAATGVLITTRPGLNIVAARHAPCTVRTIGQEHMNLGAKGAALRADIQRYYPRLDALAVLTESDRRSYSALFRSGAPPVVLLPNAVPAIDGGRADPTRKTVVAAGRLTRQKGFDRLIPAWSQVNRTHPDWRLEIYGNGPEGAALQQLVDQHGLSGTVRLMGRTKRLGDAFANSSIFVLSSRREGLPMVILEAMSKGLPVVSFDCPTGPAEIVVNDHNGVLVPNGDIPALTEALRQLIEDDEQRARLGRGALETASRYDAEAIGHQWIELIERLLSAPSSLQPVSGGSPHRPPAA
jgi:glycosyltransferase involved in cell wall biosynthesis